MSISACVCTPIICLYLCVDSYDDILIPGKTEGYCDGILIPGKTGGYCDDILIRARPEDIMMMHRYPTRLEVYYNDDGHDDDGYDECDISAMDSVPHSLRHTYQALVDIYTQIEEKFTKERTLERLYYVKYEMKKLARAYFKEAQWLNVGYIPKCEEYMKNANVTTTCMMTATTSLSFMKETIAKETFEWIINEPLILRASSAINRLKGDIIGHDLEQQRKHIASFIECYMKEYRASRQEANAEVEKNLTNAWKDMNTEFLHSTHEIPMFVLELVINIARSAYIFKENDFATAQREFKDKITLLFVDPMKKLVRAFFKEAQWLNAGHIPKCEEYMKNANVTTTCMMAATTSLSFMEETIAKEIFEWLINEPLILRASSAINRLKGDIIGHDLERQRKHIASFIKCYMKEYGALRQEANAEVEKNLANAWKDMNTEFLHSTHEMPMFVLELVINIARSTYIFKENDLQLPKVNLKTRLPCCLLGLSMFEDDQVFNL
ncbi:(E,E)-germacrene B synthase [Capsicum annuum]|nr:(E,E)-germacrene B synthase [Capsicum annuum]